MGCNVVSNCVVENHKIVVIVIGKMCVILNSFHLQPIPILIARFKLCLIAQNSEIRKHKLFESFRPKKKEPGYFSLKFF